jgi:hypothetical protein
MLRSNWLKISAVFALIYESTSKLTSSQEKPNIRHCMNRCCMCSIGSLFALIPVKVQSCRNGRSVDQHVFFSWIWMPSISVGAGVTTNAGLHADPHTVSSRLRTESTPLRC